MTERDRAGKCPGCGGAGDVGVACAEKACVVRGMHHVPVEYATWSPERPPDPSLGRRIEKYLLVKVLGAGGFGTVYLALQLPIGMRVAVKLLHRIDDPDALEEQIAKFEGEARALATLNHPNVVRLIEYGRHGDNAFLVMEFVDGGRTLKHAMAGPLREGTPLAPDVARHLLRQACDGLEAAHARGLVHRDVKPDNLMLQAVAGNPNLVRILDFGLVKFAETGSSTAHAMGTPAYLAPEQLGRKHIGPWTDVYALGVIAFEMLVGQRPFPGETSQAMLGKKIDPFYDPVAETAEGRVSPALASFLREALAREPSERIPSVQAFRERLDAALAASSTGPTEVGDVTLRGVLPAPPLREVTVSLAPADGPAADAEIPTPHDPAKRRSAPAVEGATREPAASPAVSPRSPSTPTLPIPSPSRVWGESAPDATAPAGRPEAEPVPVPPASRATGALAAPATPAAVAPTVDEVENSPLDTAGFWSRLGTGQPEVAVTRRRGSRLRKVARWTAVAAFVLGLGGVAAALYSLGQVPGAGKVGREMVDQVAGVTGKAVETLRSAVVDEAGLVPEGYARVPEGVYRGATEAAELRIAAPFLLAADEVTQAEWRTVFGNDPSKHRTCGDTCPVERVTWYDALAYANALSAREGRSACYELEGAKGTPGQDFSARAVRQTEGCSGYRLPTGSEWEVAARAGKGGAAWVSVIDSAWYRANSGGAPHPVGTRAANAWGLYDMLGNVREWTWDASGNTRRLAAGGSWADPQGDVGVGERDRVAADTRSETIGFRLARGL